MTREHKFRAWDKRNNKWFETWQIALGAQGTVFLFDGDGLWIELGEDLVDIQFLTGLKDKSGKREIYEGDFLHVEEEYSHSGGAKVIAGNHRVQYFLGDFGLYQNHGWWSISDFKVELAPRSGVIEQAEIIGNLYENPEFLGS